jgi:large subunit ribosomal protein L24
MAGRFKIKKNDQVVVISGRDKGRRGRVIEVMTTTGKVMVEGVNLRNKQVRPNRQRGIAGGIVEREAPIDISNVMLLEGGKGTRVGYQVLTDRRKVRISKRTGAVIDQG